MPGLFIKPSISLLLRAEPRPQKTKNGRTFRVQHVEPVEQVRCQRLDIVQPFLDTRCSK